MLLKGISAPSGFAAHVKKEVWDVLPRSAFGGAIGLLLAFGGFSGRQSIALGLILLIVFWIWERKADEIKKLREDKITPFSVTIHPNWHLLLTDNGLIDSEQWKELKQRDKYTIQNPGNYNVWHGISFTVLRRDLIYSNDHHVFFSRIDDISEPIEDLKTADGQSPELNIRINAGDEFVGYEIAMTHGKYFLDPLSRPV